MNSPDSIQVRGGDVLRRLDRRPADVARDAIVQISVVHNEALRLPYLLDYHRQLGVDRFFMIDNDSDDGTGEFLLEQPDVHLFHTAASYGASRFGVTWVNAIAREFAMGHWTLIVDADELLVYPECERVDLAEFTRRLEGQRHSGLLTFLLDMYDDLPVSQTTYERGTPFLERCPYFDGDGYEYAGTGVMAQVPRLGGPRQRAFWAGQPGSPLLPKVPLVRWGRRTALRSSTHEVRGVRLATTTGALLHFKLFSDFVETVPDEVERGEHWNDGAQYRSYAEGLDANPDLSLVYPGSVRYRDSTQLIELGLMHR